MYKLIRKWGEGIFEEKEIDEKDKNRDEIFRILKIYLIEGEKRRLIAYFKSKDKEVWIDEDIVNLIKDKQEKEFLASIIEHIKTIDKNEDISVVIITQLGNLVQSLIWQEFIVEEEYVGGGPPKLL